MEQKLATFMHVIRRSVRSNRACLFLIFSSRIYCWQMKNRTGRKSFHSFLFRRLWFLQWKHPCFLHWLVLVMPFYFSKDGKISNDYKLFFTLITFFCNMDFLASPDLNMILMCFFFVWTIPDMCLSRNEKKREKNKII